MYAKIKRFSQLQPRIIRVLQALGIIHLFALPYVLLAGLLIIFLFKVFLILVAIFESIHCIFLIAIPKLFDLIFFWRSLKNPHLSKTGLLVGGVLYYLFCHIYCKSSTAMILGKSALPIKVALFTAGLWIIITVTAINLDRPKNTETTSNTGSD